MATHPIQLALRFLLEVLAMIAVGVWGWHLGAGIFKWLFALGIPIICGALWATFNVPNDGSRSGNAPVVIPGILRLILELGMFGLATFALFKLHHINQGYIFGIVVMLHYITSYDRVIWLISNKKIKE